MINVFQPCVGNDELNALAPVFRSCWLGAGARLTEFLQSFARHLGVSVSELQSVSTCTEGLFQAVAALRLAPGDEVVLPAVSFVGAANAILACGARPVLCDVDQRTLNPTPEHVEAALTPRTKAIIVLHYGGHPGWIEEIAELARTRSLKLIEDAACAIGSSVGGRMCGTFGDIGVWSFDSMKILVTGDGGVLWTRDPAIAARVGYGTFLGLDAPGMAKAATQSAWWEVDPTFPGRRARMNDVSAAIGTVQLGRLPNFLWRRAQIAARYTEAFGRLDWLLLPPSPQPGTATSWYFYWIQTSPGVRDTLAHHLRDAGIYTTFRYWPLHRMQLYATDRSLPGADNAAASTLLLPIHNGLSDADVEIVINAVGAFRADRSAQ